MLSYRKNLCLILCLILSLVVFSGCGKSKKPIEIIDEQDVEREEEELDTDIPFEDREYVTSENLGTIYFDFISD